jgi:hypothetical protein
MIIATKYLRPNITIEYEMIDSKKYYVYNYQGVHYRVFNSLMSLGDFLFKEADTWIFDCCTEDELERYLYKTA